MKSIYIVLGMIFIVDPMLGLHDFLPDFIGCLLISFGIRDCACMVEKLAVSKRYFMYAAFVSVIRFAIGFTGAENVNTLPLTISFSLAVIETIIYIPAFRSLFSGIEFALMRHGGSGILSLGKRNGIYKDEHGVPRYGEIQRDSTGNVSVFSQVFIVLRAGVSLLPELPALQLTDLGYVDSFRFDSIDNLIKLVSVLIVLIPGIVLLCLYIRLFSRIGKADDFISSVNAELHRRFGDLSEMRACSYMRLASVLTGASVLLYMGFYDYQINVIPRFVTAAAVVVSSVVILLGAGKGRRRWICAIPLIPAAAAIPLSRMTYRLQYDYYSLFRQRQMMSMQDINAEYVYDMHINRIRPGYMHMAAVECAEAVVCGIAVIALLTVYFCIVLSHAGSFNSIPDRKRKETAFSLKLRGAFMFAGAVITVSYFAAYRYILPYFSYAPVVGIAVNLLAVVLFAVFSVQANSQVYGNIYLV